jgi:NitT/TauT family transport system ATP-binding protein
VAEEVLLFHRVYTSFGAEEVHRGLTFSVRAGEVACLVGPSGCGKTTALRIIAGLLDRYQGTVRIAGLPPQRAWMRQALVFQSPRLAYWSTALANVELGLELRFPRMDRRQRRLRAVHYLEAVGLAADLHKYTLQLSGGERHRVALARAFAVEPDLLLMDEPFSDLDVATRARLWDLTLHLSQATRRTVLMVTHDLEEALYLADRVFVLSPKPSSVLLTVEVASPRPRDMDAPLLASLRSRMRTALEEAVRNRSEVA